MRFDIYGNPIPDEVYMPQDDFEAVADNSRRASSTRPGNVRVDSSWAQLIAGKTIGKGANLDFRAATSATAVQSSPVDILDVRGEDSQATQLCLTLGVPEIYDGLVGTVNLQSLTGSQDNIALVNVFPAGLVGGRVNNVRNNRAFGNPIAIVEWGAGGIQNRCEADFINGLCLNLSGSFCRVRAFVDGNSIAPDQADAFYRVAACIGPGFAKPNNAQRTMWMSDANAINVESDVYTVPRFSKAVHLCGANEVHDTFVGDIRFYRTPNGPVDASFVADYVFAGNTPGPIPIPNGAYYFTFVPRIANCFSMMAVFQLAV